MKKRKRGEQRVDKERGGGERGRAVHLMVAKN